MWSLFVLFFCFDTITTLPCSTNAIGAIHCLPPLAAPQEPMVDLLFRRLLTLIPQYHPSPTPVPPPFNPVHPSNPDIINPIASYQTEHKNPVYPKRTQEYQYLYNPLDTIQPIQSRQSIRYDPASISSEGNSPTRLSLIRNTHPKLPQLTQHPDFIPRLLLMPPNMIFHPP